MKTYKPAPAGSRAFEDPDTQTFFALVTVSGRGAKLAHGFLL